jgi:apolipoprotein N-acyltransferase
LDYLRVPAGKYLSAQHGSQYCLQPDEFLPILQFASITGIWGIDFCVFLFPATLAALIVVRGQTGLKKLLPGGVGFFCSWCWASANGDCTDPRLQP